jgi:hypothetical protein
MTKVPSSVGFLLPETGAWFGANWFFVTHFDVRADVIIRRGTDPTIFFQGHTYF